MVGFVVRSYEKKKMFFRGVSLVLCLMMETRSKKYDSSPNAEWRKCIERELEKLCCRVDDFINLYVHEKDLLRLKEIVAKVRHVRDPLRDLDEIPFPTRDQVLECRERAEKLFEDLDDFTLQYELKEMLIRNKLEYSMQQFRQKMALECIPWSEFVKRFKKED